MNNDFVQATGDQYGEITSSPLADTAQQVEAGKIIIHKEPRISANKLAEYVVADPTRQKAIIRDCKFARKVVIVHYKKTRDFIARAFAPDSLDIDKLVRRAEEIERENAEAGVHEISDWLRNDNANSALALKKIAVVAPDLSWKNAGLFHGRLEGIQIAGVKVSIHPEIIFSFEHRNIKKVGAIILNTAKGHERSLDRKNGAYCVGDYLSSLLFQMLLLRAHRIGAPLNSKCYAVDVFREKTYTAPASYRTLNKNLEAACEVIALRWPEIKQKA